MLTLHIELPIKSCRFITKYQILANNLKKLHNNIIVECSTMLKCSNNKNPILGFNSPLKLLF